MRTPQFIALLQETHRKMLDLTASKGAEYAGDRDQLANFKRLGLEMDETPEKALWHLLKKHMDSLRTYIMDTERGITREYSEPITGRVDDAILYLMLLKALIVEREGLGGDLQPEAVLPPPPQISETFADLGPEASPSIEEMQADIAQWADTVYPNRTAHGSLAKLVMEEIPEFITCKMKDPLEYADLVIMILDIAHLQGINVGRAVVKKMHINRKRTWKVEEGTGFLKHQGEFPC